MSDFFPFTIRGPSYCDEYNHSGGVSEFRKVFQTNRPEKIIRIEAKGTKWEYSYKEDFCWYCFDVIVHSKTSVEFVCFDMHDFASGGRGEEIHRFVANVTEDLIAKFISNRLFKRAIVRRERELLLKENLICKDYAAQEAQELGLIFLIEE